MVRAEISRSAFKHYLPVLRLPVQLRPSALLCCSVPDKAHTCQLPSALPPTHPCMHHQNFPGHGVFSARVDEVWEAVVDGEKVVHYHCRLVGGVGEGGWGRGEERAAGGERGASPRGVGLVGGGAEESCCAGRAAGLPRLPAPLPAGTLTLRLTYCFMLPPRASPSCLLLFLQYRYEDGEADDFELHELLPLLDLDQHQQQQRRQRGAGTGAGAAKRGPGRPPKQQAAAAVPPAQRGPGRPPAQRQVTLTGGRQRRNAGASAARGGSGATSAAGATSAVGATWQPLEPTPEALEASRQPGSIYAAGGAGHERGVYAWDGAC